MFRREIQVAANKLTLNRGIMMDLFLRLLPVILFFAFLIILGFYIQNHSSDSRAKNYSKDYYIGGRSLGGFVLAMTLVATYSSVSSFLSGPGVAWKRGFGWVYLSSIQIVAAFLILGILGKKMAVVGRKTDSVTVIDIIRQRYQSNTLAIFSAFVIIVFFTTQMVGQFIGGAQIFSAAIGINYKLGLLLFALVVIFYTTVGGFKAVAITDTVCAIAMIFGMISLAVSILVRGGGIQHVMETLTTVAANNKATGAGPDLMSPTASGLISVPALVSYWLLVGVCTIGLPQSSVRCLSYKNSKSVHLAMIVGTIVVGAMMIGMHMLGVLSRAVLPAVSGSTDTVIPTLIENYMSPVISGITIAGPLAATMSTISSLLISGSSAIVKDLYVHSKEAKNEEIVQKKVGRISLLVTAIMGIFAVVIAVRPPAIIFFINMFAFGGLEVVFFWPFILGLFWKNANDTGALFGSIGGLAVYCIFTKLGIHLFGFSSIVPGIVCSLIFFIIGSLAGRPNDEKVMQVFFPERTVKVN